MKDMNGRRVFSVSQVDSKMFKLCVECLKGSICCVVRYMFMKDVLKEIIIITFYRTPVVKIVSQQFHFPSFSPYYSLLIKKMCTTGNIDIKHLLLLF